MTTPQERRESQHLIQVMCEADPTETIPLMTLVRLARAIIDAGYRRPPAGSWLPGEGYLRGPDE